MPERTSSEGSVVFTDGAAKGNPGPGGWGAIVATADGRVAELGGAAPHTTNNRMELTAAIEALAWLRSTPGPVAVYSDSTYVLRGISEWLRGWRRRGWRTAEGGAVLNRDLWEKLDALVREREGGVAWHHVRGHAAIPGNERADAIADGHAAGRPVDLYRGAADAYPVSLDPTAAGAPPPRSANRARRSAPAHSYLSLVDGVPMRHATWADCERRVKGRSGARFKKSTSTADEEAILRAWGVSAADVRD